MCVCVCACACAFTATLLLPLMNHAVKAPNRVDFVFTYACVHGPGGRKGNKSMSLEAFAFASKGIAHETGRPHEEVMECLMRAEPLLNAADMPGIPVSARLQHDRAARAIGEDMWHAERVNQSPLVQGGVLATYASYLSQRDAQQAQQSKLAHHGPPPRSPRVHSTPEWAAYSSPDRRRIARRLAWPAQQAGGLDLPLQTPPLTPG